MDPEIQDTLGDLPRKGSCPIEACDEEVTIRLNNAGEPMFQCSTLNAVVNTRGGYGTLADSAFSDHDPDEVAESDDEPDDSDMTLEELLTEENDE